MYLENIILHQFQTHPQALSQLLNIYDKEIKQHGINPGSKEAMELYASIIKKFKQIGNKKQDMDPNMFSFGKQNINKWVRTNSISKQLKFEHQGEKNQTKKQSNLQKDATQKAFKQKQLKKTQADLKPKKEALKSLVPLIQNRQKFYSQFFTTKRSSQTFQTPEQFPPHPNVVPSPIITNSQNSYIDLNQSLAQINSQTLQKVLFFARLKQSHQNSIQFINVMKLHQLVLKNRRNKFIAKRWIQLMKQNVQIAKQSQQQISNFYQIKMKTQALETFKKYVKIVKSKTNQKLMNKIRLDLLSKKIVMNRLLNSKKTHNIQHSRQISLLLELIKLRNQSLKNKFIRSLSDSHLQIKSLEQELKSNLCESSRKHFFKALQKQKKQRLQWIKQNGQNKVCFIFDFIQNIPKTANFNVKSYNQQIERLKTIKPISKALQQQKLRSTYNLIIKSLKQERNREQKVKLMIKKNLFKGMVSNCSEQFKFKIQSKQMAQKIKRLHLKNVFYSLESYKIWIEQKEYINHFAFTNNSNEFFKCFRIYFARSKISSDLKHQVSRFRYITTLRIYFSKMKKQLQKDKYQRQIINIIDQERSKVLLKQIFIAIKQQTIKGKVLKIKMQTLSKIKIRRAKQYFFKVFDLNTTTHISNLRDRRRISTTFRVWNFQTNYSNVQKKLLKSLQQDKNLKTIQECFEAIKANSLKNKKSKQIEASIRWNTQNNLKQKFFGLMIKQTVKTLKKTIDQNNDQKNITNNRL